MAKKIRENMEWHIERVKQDKYHYPEAREHLTELGDLVHKMWVNDLISDKVKAECFKAIESIGWELINIYRGNFKEA